MCDRSPLAVLVGIFALAAACAAGPAAGQTLPQQGQLIASFDFHGDGGLDVWSTIGEGRSRLAEAADGSRFAVIERPAADGAGSVMLRTPLPVEKLRGRAVNGTARVKADEVTKPAEPWNGVKFMVHTNGPSGPTWANASNLWGSFDWRITRFAGLIPADATEAWLVIGLQDSSGRASFDDLRITTGAGRRERPSKPATQRSDASMRHARLRGAMVSESVTAADLRVVAGEWNANVIRYQLHWTAGRHESDARHDMPLYDRWLAGRLDHLDSLLPVCRELGLAVVLDLHTPPGGAIMVGDWPLFEQKIYQDKFIEVWEHMARRYRGEEVIWGFDLANEPIEGGVVEGLMDWRTLALATAQRIRAIDPQRTLIIEAALGGAPEGLDLLQPLPLENIVYSVHMYLPHRFTHQRVFDAAQPPVSYPGPIDGATVDKAWLRSALRPVIAYQRDYGVRIYIGEFSAIRWAPDDSAERYVRDCIELFEEYGWDWTYHAFREWHGWSVEHGGDKDVTTPATQPTARQRLLLSAFSANRRPAW